MEFEELTDEVKLTIAQQQRQEYRIQLERARNEMGLVIFLKDEQSQQRIRADSEKIARAIEYYDKIIRELNANLSHSN